MWIESENDMERAAELREALRRLKFTNDADAVFNVCVVVRRVTAHGEGLSWQQVRDTISEVYTDV